MEDIPIGFKVHPIYTNYAADINGNIYSNKRRIIIKQFIHNNGYCYFGIHINGITKNYICHRFIFECFHGIIPDGLVIDHKNSIKNDNRLENLQLLTHQQNVIKGYNENPDHQRIVSVTIIFEDGSEKIYTSQATAARELNAGPEMISKCYRGIHKSFISRSTGKRYRVKRPNQDNE